MTKTIPQQIKSFIKYLKDQEIYQLTDHQNSYLYLSKENQKLPINQLGVTFRSTYKNESDMWEEFSSYVVSSLQTIIATKFNPTAIKLIPTSLDQTYYLNSYKAYPTPELPVKDAPLWLEFLERLFPDANERHTVSQWLAHIFQVPQERPSWHLMFSSDTGTGKGFLFNDILRPLLCHQTYLCESYSSFLKPFSQALDSTLLCLLDDPKSRSDSTQTQLKSKLTEENQVIERKFEQPTTQTIYTRVILASNEHRPLKVDNSERRWFVPKRLEHKVNPEETQLFISRLSEWLETDGLATIHNWFMEYDITDFNHKHINQTESLKEMIDASKPIEVQDLEDWIKVNPVFKWENLRLAFDVADNLLKSYITEMAYVYRSVDLDGTGRTRWWMPKKIKNREAKELLNIPTPLF